MADVNNIEVPRQRRNRRDKDENNDASIKRTEEIKVDLEGPLIIDGFKIHKDSIYSLLNDHMGLLEDSGSISDVLIRIKAPKVDSVFNLFSSILKARSKWFNANLNSEDSKGTVGDSNIEYEILYEDNTYEVVFNNIHPEIFREFVKYLSVATGRIRRATGIELLKLAHFFEINSLKEAVARFYEKYANEKIHRLTTTDAIRLIKALHEYNTSENVREAYTARIRDPYTAKLRDTCFKLIRHFKKSLLQDEEWDDFQLKYAEFFQLALF